ncbi:MAG TPA: hypothetical protein VFT64_11455 [Rickettsiales bacterium]|nr:hypothetical protein [Rickettsiales bacterium]
MRIQLKAVLFSALMAMSLSACNTSYPLAGKVPNTNEHFTGSVTTFTLNNNATILFTTDRGTRCYGVYPLPLSGGDRSMSGSGTFKCNDGRLGIFAFSGTIYKGTGIGKFNNGNKFTFAYGTNLPEETDGVTSPALWKDY